MYTVSAFNIKCAKETTYEVGNTYKEVLESKNGRLKVDHGQANGFMTHKGSRPMKVHDPKEGRTLEDLDVSRVFEGPKWYTKEMQKEKG